MYAKGIFDICKNIAPNENGSLDHVDVSFCIKYSYTHNGPCQNGGELINPRNLAIDARCRCKAGYSGDFCDTVSKAIVCTEIVDDSLGDLPDCTKRFIAYSDHPYCFLTLDSRTQYVCDTRTNATEISFDAVFIKRENGMLVFN
eukprot:XP_019926694.1 PREDICTED: uncharacterized protein LOC105337530 [Crassostrea gigas]